VPSQNFPHPSGSGGSGDSEPTRSRWEPTPAGDYDELNAIAADPVMRRHARRLAPGFAEDLLQQTWYTVARVSARTPIRDLGAYFYTVMVNTAKHLRDDIARHGVPVDDPVAAAGPRRGRELAAAPAEEDALLRLLSDARRELLHRRRAELRSGIPACSPHPSRYRDAILDLAERMLADDGPDSRPEVNAALIAAYPEWFDGPGVAAATKYQRRCRGREDVWRVLTAVISPQIPTVRRGTDGTTPPPHRAPTGLPGLGHRRHPSRRGSGPRPARPGGPSARR
jgi:hypothetical protein